MRQMSNDMIERYGFGSSLFSKRKYCEEQEEESANVKGQFIWEINQNNK